MHWHLVPLSGSSLYRMSVAGDFYQFRDGEFHLLTHALTDLLTVADSFLISQGQVRAVDRHFDRFRNSVGNRESSNTLDLFEEKTLALLPRTGHIFPRLEYRQSLPEGQRLFLRIRSAPELSRTVTLWSSDAPDPRTNFCVKGPDLSACQRLRRAANLRGADEAVILSDSGHIADGALSSIVWWEEETLCGPDEQSDWLPSITRELVFELARQAGYSTEAKQAKPADLEGLEIWSLSALQGIRGVTSWQSMPVGVHRFLEPFRKRLGMLSQQLP